MRLILSVFLLLAGLQTACTRQSTPASSPAKAEVHTEVHAAQGTKIAVIGDFGQAGPDEAAVATLVHTWDPDFVITTGDNNYPHGKRDTFDANIGDYYHAYIRFDAKYTGAHRDHGSPTQRFFPALGNHDWYSGEGDRPHADYFDLPGNERYYTTALGPQVDLFVVDSDDHEPDGIDASSKQGQWLQAALKASKAPWKLVTMHHPPYSRGEHGDNTRLQWPYAAWGASAVIAGHDHDYERVVKQNFPYWVVGTSGAAMRGFNDKVYADATADVMYHDKHGAMLCDATPAKLTCQFMAHDKEVIDTFALQRTP